MALCAALWEIRAMKFAVFFLVLAAGQSGIRSGHAQQAAAQGVCDIDFRPIGAHAELPPHAVYADTGAASEARAADVVNRLTFEEKLSLTGGYRQFFFPGVIRHGRTAHDVVSQRASAGCDLEPRAGVALRRGDQRGVPRLGDQRTAGAGIEPLPELRRRP
jgi:hypothetical protein